MSRSPANELLAELRERGVELGVQDGRLRFRPAGAAAPDLRARMAALKAELIALINPPVPSMPDIDAGNGAIPVPDRCPQCGEPDIVHPRAGSPGRCARCEPSNLPCMQINWGPRAALTAPFEARASASCYACGATARWRLRSEAPWVCQRCHPPLIAADAVEVVS